MKSLSRALMQPSRAARPRLRCHTRPRCSNTQQNHQRWSSNTTGDGQSSKPSSSWKIGPILAVAAVTGGLGYAFGIYDTNSRMPELWERGTKPKYGTPSDLKSAIAELREIFGEDTISTDEEDLHLHGFSEWSTVNSDRLPVAVAYPKSTEDVSQIAKVCHKYRMPMIPYSGGSSLEGNFSAPYGGMSIDFIHMDQIVQMHEDDMDVVVQPSIQWMRLNEEIKESGMFFPIDPGPSAKIGGMVGTNCSGTNAVRYGTMKDWVINLTVVLADGRVIKTRQRPRKTSAGYNLTGMFVGSEGTLGIVTEITLKLAVRPEQTRVGIATFPSIRDAANAAMRVIRTGVPVQCVEILDDVQMRVINRAGGTNRSWEETPTLFFKFSGNPSGISNDITATKGIAKQNGCRSFEFAKNDQEGEDLWSARKQSLWSMLALRTSGSDVWSTDVAVPLSRLPDIIESSKEDLDKLGLFAGIVGHIGDGNFHEGIMYDSNVPGERAKIEKCVYDMVDRALEMDGSCTGEHGIGLGKKEFLMKEVGPETIGVMRSIKRSLDPYWLLNPGKIFDATRSEEEKK